LVTFFAVRLVTFFAVFFLAAMGNRSL
jgi:hypothetical protein